MTFILVDNAILNNRFYSVTGTFSLTIRIPCFYQQSSWKIINYLPEANAYTAFIAQVNSDFINLHRGVTTLIPIDPYPKLAASQHPAVSSLEAYQTPAH